MDVSDSRKPIFEPDFDSVDDHSDPGTIDSTNNFSVNVGRR